MYRTSGVISALLSAAIFWPLLILEAFTVAVILGFIKAGNFRGMLILMLFGTTLFLVAGVLFLLVSWFFSSAGCLVSIVSLGLSAICFYLWWKAYLQFLFNMQAGKPDLKITFAIAFSEAVSFFFLLHGAHVGLLDRIERAALYRNPVKELAAIGTRGRRTVENRFLARVLAGVLQVVAKMVQGLSVYISAFVLGSALFWGGLGPRLAINSAFQTNPVNLRGELKWIFILVAAYAIMLAIVFLLTQGTFALKRRARHLTRFSYAQTVEHDKRPPILFLRSFLDDQVTLPKPPLYLTYLMAEPVPRRLDHALIERFGYLAPVVAIGKPG